MFEITKMTIRLADGRIVEIDFNNAGLPIAATSAPLAPEEELNLCLRLSCFYGGGAKALEELEQKLN